LKGFANVKILITENGPIKGNHGRKAYQCLLLGLYDLLSEDKKINEEGEETGSA